MIGETVSHYKILEKIGEGGMGVVYKAEDTRLKRTVALKFLPAEMTRDAQAKERFVQEAQAASALDHPNICTIHQIDETDDGRTFICMTCYDGETLEERIATGPLSVEEAAGIAAQIAAGLAKAHAQGIVHRDVKPANVFLTGDGQVKIFDFGLAKLAGLSRLTRDGTAVGTAAYMSPEQTSGEDVDHRTDIWALGAVLYEMISGKLPFEVPRQVARRPLPERGRVGLRTKTTNENFDGHSPIRPARHVRRPLETADDAENARSCARADPRAGRRLLCLLAPVRARRGSRRRRSNDARCAAVRKPGASRK
jgi:serine/threonine protein kinase